VATAIPLDVLAAPADTVSVCFSKGLGAPVGSVLAGDHSTITRAHRFRKQFGGGMRQVGILAAACLFALDHHLERLAEDHGHAQRIFEGLVHPRLRVNHPVETNIVIVDVSPPATSPDLLDYLASQGIRAVGFGPDRIRLVANLEVTGEDIDRVCQALNSFPG
jgi:threonine aldolase